VGATFGLLIKGGAVLENMHSNNCIVMDKTGTLTSGTAVLGTRVDYIQQDDILLQNLPVAASDVGLWLAACAETQSAHPLASAIVDAAKGVWGSDVTRSQEGVRIDGFVDVPGRGVECRVVKDGWGDRYVRVGSRVWAKDGKLDSLTGDSSRDNTGDNDADNLRSKSGQIVVYVSVLEAQGSSQSQRRQIVSVIGIVDPIAKEAKSTVAALQRLGIDVWMCTGDHAVTAQSVAQQVGIHEDNVCAGVTPEGKADLVTRLQSRNMTKDKKSIVSRVGMVGDGINDAVALARADVGIAIGAGNKIAVEAADIVLVRSSLHDVVVAVHLSRVVFRRIVINFVWAMGYNIIAIPFAAGAIASLTKFRLPPEFAGLMMAFSSVSVVSSSLLLGNYKRPVILESGVFEPGVSCVEARWKSLCEALSTRLDREINYVDVPTNSDFELV
jgi:Cu+-exporting ATPase